MDKALHRPHVRRLILRDFRSFPTLDVTFGASLIGLTGENGVGKTNCLEALSLFVPGRGLRRAEWGHIARKDGPGGFSIGITLDECEVRMGVGLEASSQARIYHLEGEKVGSVRAFADYVHVIWLTPAMDPLLSGPPGDRRKFLDRLVLALDPKHGARVGQFERTLRGRNRLLEEGGHSAWLEAVEREIAELGVAIATARRACIEHLRKMILFEKDQDTPFPWAELSLHGEMETIIETDSALIAEDRYRALLHKGRKRDAAAGRTLIGPHVTDLQVMHGPKAVLAAQASTGEQKALLVGLVLAHARLVAEQTGRTPIALLDEIAAHFDPCRRAALLSHLQSLGGQVFLTSADPEVFKHPDISLYRVHDGVITAC